MSIFVPKHPYKFSKKRVNALLKEYLPELKMQPGEIMDILVFTLDFEGKFKREMCTTRYVIVHRHSDGAVLIWENYRNNWGGLGFKRFSKDAINSRVKTCWSIKDFEEFLCAISCNLQGHVFGTTNLTQVPMEYACINDKPILDEDGVYIRLPFTTLDGNYVYKKGDYETCAAKIRSFGYRYKIACDTLLAMNPGLDELDLAIIF